MQTRVVASFQMPSTQRSNHWGRRAGTAGKPIGEHITRSAFARGVASGDTGGTGTASVGRHTRSYRPGQSDSILPIPWQVVRQEGR